MWIKRALWEEMIVRNAEANERCKQLIGRMAEKDCQVGSLEARCEALMDDLRKVFGLKNLPKPAAAPQPVGDIRDTPSPQNHQFKMKETPRDALSRLQAEHNRQANAEAQLEIRAAIADYESVLR